MVGVQWHAVPPQCTSRICPECGYQDKLNLNGNTFKCLRCGHTEDADVVGAKNILRRFIEGSIVPLPARTVLVAQ
ncbi:MAG: transposase [Aquificaceae bacterium]|nr:transposase [Aquificaceae bacterium]